jgi:hypothetical protein
MCFNFITNTRKILRPVLQYEKLVAQEAVFELPGTVYNWFTLKRQIPLCLPDTMINKTFSFARK